MIYQQFTFSAYDEW